MAWYKTGTVTVTNGSATVTGAATAFVGAVLAGHGFAAPDGKLYEIDTVVSATQITPAAPGLRFTADGDTGFTNPAANQIGIVTGGVLRALLSGTAFNLSVPLTGTAVTQTAIDTTWYAGPSVTLPAGTWLVIASAGYLKNATGVGTVYVRLWDGAAAHASGSMYHPSTAGVTVEIGMPPTVIVLATETVISVEMTTNSAGANTLFRAAMLTNGQGNNISQIVAVRLN